jgi:hypothetical protein
MCFSIIDRKSFDKLAEIAAEFHRVREVDTFPMVRDSSFSSIVFTLSK